MSSESSPTIRVTFLESDRVVCLPARVVLQWKQAVKYLSISDETVDETTLDGREFTVASFMSDQIFDLIVDFTKRHLEHKVTHIKGPTYTVTNPLLEPWNVPDWAFEWYMRLEPFTLGFDLLEAADQLQFAPLVELMGFALAQLYVSMTKKLRDVIATGGVAMDDDRLAALFEKHKDWCNTDADVTTTY